MKFVVYATHSERYYPALIKTFEKFHCDYIILGFGEPWIDYLNKLEAIVDWCRMEAERDPNSVVSILDGFDAIVTGDPNDMERDFKKTGKEILYSADRCSRPLYRIFWGNSSWVGAGVSIGYARSYVNLLGPPFFQKVKI